MRCPKCGGDVRVKVELFLDIPWRLFHNLNKEALRSRDVRVEGANWPKNLLYCVRGDWMLREGGVEAAVTTIVKPPEDTEH